MTIVWLVSALCIINMYQEANENSKYHNFINLTEQIKNEVEIDVRFTNAYALKDRTKQTKSISAN